MRHNCQGFAFIKSDMFCAGRIASPTDSPRGQHQHSGSAGDSEQDAEAAYHRMELLSQSIRNELQRDLHIHDSAVLPNFVNLPQVCAEGPQNTFADVRFIETLIAAQPGLQGLQLVKNV